MDDVRMRFDGSLWESLRDEALRESGEDTVGDSEEAERYGHPRRRLTRHEQLQGLADSGCDTWEEYRGER